MIPEFEIVKALRGSPLNAVKVLADVRAISGNDRPGKYVLTEIHKDVAAYVDRRVAP